MTQYREELDQYLKAVDIIVICVQFKYYHVQITTLRLFSDSNNSLLRLTYIQIFELWFLMEVSTFFEHHALI